MTAKNNNQTEDKKTSKEPKFFILISFLYVLVFINSVILVLCVTALNLIRKNPQNTQLINTLPPLPIIISTLILAILSVIFLLALIKWRKWGFWGCFLTFAGYIVISLKLGTPWQKALLNFIGLFLLFAIYQIGGKKKAWNKLR